MTPGETTSISLSVVIPLYNKQDYIVRALSSVFAQSYQDFEVVVVDDGSTDAGVERAQEAFGSDARLRIVSQANAGVSATRNRGFSEMRGEYAVFLDADDEWLPEHLEHIAETARAFPDAGLIGTGYRHLCPGDYAVEVTVDAGKPVLIPDYFRMAIHRHILTMSSCAVHRAVFETVGGFVVGEPLGEDSEFYARGALRFPVAYDPRVTAIYHNEVVSGAVGGHARNWQPDAFPLARQLEDLCRQATLVELIPSLESYVAHSFYEHIVFGIKSGSHLQARALLDQQVLLKKIPGRVRRLKIASRCLPPAIIWAYFRLTRSRLRDIRGSSRGGVVVRPISLPR